MLFKKGALFYSLVFPTDSFSPRLYSSPCYFMKHDCRKSQGQESIKRKGDYMYIGELPYFWLHK